MELLVNPQKLAAWVKEDLEKERYQKAVEASAQSGNLIGVSADELAQWVEEDKKSFRKQVRARSVQSFFDSAGNVVESTFARGLAQEQSIPMSSVFHPGVSPRDFTPDQVMDKMTEANRPFVEAARIKQSEWADKIRNMSPESVRKAVEYSRMAKHDTIGQVMLDVADNLPNTAAAFIGQAVNTVAPGLGTAGSFGFMAANVEKEFREIAEMTKVPAEFADKYAINYAFVSGAIENVQQALNVSKLLGKALPASFVKKMTSSLLKRIASRLSQIGITGFVTEGLEELSQEALKYKVLSVMVKDYAKKTGVKFETNEALPLNEDGTVNWKDATKDLVEAFKSGGGVNAFYHALGLTGRASRAAGKKYFEYRRDKKINKEINAAEKQLFDDIDAVAGEIGNDVDRETLLKETMMGDKFIGTWIAEYPEQAAALQAEEDPTSRRSFERAGLPRWLNNKEDREAFIKRIPQVQQARMEAEQAEVDPAEQEMLDAERAAIQEEAQQAVAPVVVEEDQQPVIQPEPVVEEVAQPIQEEDQIIEPTPVQEEAPKQKKSFKKKKREPIRNRMLREDGRVIDDQGGIMAGDTFKTSSGRETTPYPKQIKRMHKGDLRMGNQWLIDNAIEEAATREDDFNLTSFKNMNADNFSRADSDTANMYLFGEQPNVPAPITRPLVETSAVTQKPATKKPAPETKVQWIQQPGTFDTKQDALLAARKKTTKRNKFRVQENPINNKWYIEKEVKLKGVKKRQTVNRPWKSEERGVATPVSDFIFYNGRLLAGRKAKKNAKYAGEYNDAPAMTELGNFAKGIFGGNISADEMASMLYDANLIPDNSTTAMWDAINNEVTGYRSGKEGRTKNETAEDRYYNEMIEADEAFFMKKAENSEDYLEPDTIVTLDIEFPPIPHKVLGLAVPTMEDIDEGIPSYNLENQRTSEIITAPRISIIEYDAEAVKKAEEQANNDQSGNQKTGRKDTQSRSDNVNQGSGKESGEADKFTLERQTEEDIQEEKLKAAKKAEREALQESANNPLTAKEIDTTGDMLDTEKADNPLFAPGQRGVGAAGARSQGEFTRARQAVTEETEAANATGLRESVAEIERRNLGMPPEVKDLRRTFPDVLDKAWGILSKDKFAGQNLIDELTLLPRPLADYEVAMLLIEKVERFNARNDANSRIVELIGDENATTKQKSEAERAAQAAERRLEEIFEVVARGKGKSITETARGLNALRMMMSDQYTVLAMEESLRAKRGGKATTKEQLEKLAAIEAKYKDANEKLRKEIERLTEERDAANEAAAIYKANEELARLTAEVNTGPENKSPFRQKVLSAVDELDAMFDKMQAEMRTRASSGIDPTYLAMAAIKGASILLKTAVTISDWMAKMRTYFPNASDDDLQAILEESKKKAREVHSQLVQDEIKAEDAAESAAPKKRRGFKKDQKPTTMERMIKKLYREAVGSGIEGLNAVNDWVHDIVVQQDPTLTKERVRDIFSGYGKTIEMNRTDIDKILSDLRRQAQLMASIERVMNELAPLKSGTQREPPSPKVRELERQLKHLMREAGIETRSNAQIASAMKAKETRLKNRLTDLRNAIAENKRLVGTERVPVETNDAIIELEQLVDIEQKKYDEMFPKEPLSPEKRLKIAIKAQERSLKKINDKLEQARAVKVPEVNYTAAPTSELLENLKAQRKEAQAELNELLELLEPNKKAIESKYRRIKSAIKETERRIKEKDFTVRRREDVDISGHKAAMAAQRELEEVKMEFARMKEEERLKSLSPAQLVLEYGLKFSDTVRDIKASYDLSALGRQAAFAFLAHPIVGMQNTVKMYKSLNRENSAIFAEQLRNRKNWSLYSRFKLGIIDDDGTGNFTRVEDRFRLDMAGYVPGVKASNRAYATFLNLMRADLFDKLVENGQITEDAELAAIADGVNVMTGRGSLGKISTEGIAHFVWAPRFLAAAFQIIIGKNVLWTGTRKTKLIFAKEWGRVWSSVALIYAMEAMFRDDDDEPPEWDLRSSSVGAIRIPGTNFTFNPLNFIRTPLVFLARIATGVTKTAAGKKKLRKKAIMLPWERYTEKELAKLAKEGKKTFTKKQWNDARSIDDVKFGSGYDAVVWRFLKSKLHPAVGLIHTALSGETFSGKQWYDMSQLEQLQEIFGPLAIADVDRVRRMESTDWAVPLGTAIAHGIDIQPDYTSPEFMKAEAGSKENFESEVGSVLMKGTRPSATEYEIARTKRMLEFMGENECSRMLEQSYQGDTRTRYKNGNLTPYGNRIIALSRIESQRKAEKAKK